MTGPILLPAAARRVQPWKNGGGRTTTIVEAPPGASLDALDWRISIADIDTTGPFSLFPGMTRHLLVLTGGVRLVGRDVDAMPLMAGGTVTFSGDAEIDATPLADATRVVNLMVRRDRFDGSLRRIASGRERLQTDIAVYVAETATIVTVAGRDHPLNGEDGLMLAGPAAILSGSDIIAVDIVATSSSTPSAASRITAVPPPATITSRLR